MSLLIGLDYDDTVTADPALWTNFIRKAKEGGHEVVIVTSRTAPTYEMEWLGLPIHQTFGEAKKPYMERHGHKVHIWIDNHAEILTQNASWWDGVQR